MRILIGNGLVLAPEGLSRADVLVEGDCVELIGPRITQRADRVLDAGGCFVGPGFVDLHTHFRDPGQTDKEDLSSGFAAAAAGGFTAAVAMPNTEPALDRPDLILDVIERARRLGVIEMAVAGALTKSRAGREPSDLESLYDTGVRLFTDDGDAVEDGAIAASLMQRLASLDGAVFAQHAEDSSLTVGGHMHEGQISRRLGVRGMPASAEENIVSRDLELVRQTGARYHCQHTSTAGTVEQIRRAKEDGLPVTAEVTPHHLTFDVEHVSDLDTRFKMYPPLRERSDRHALVSGLLDGTLDAVATDHAPHTAEEKARRFEEAPRGVIGLETAASATWSIMNDPEMLFDRLSTAPARIAGLADQGRRLAIGTPANIVVFDPKTRWVAREFRSKAHNSAFTGSELVGRPVATIYRGQVTYEMEAQPA